MNEATVDRNKPNDRVTLDERLGGRLVMKSLQTVNSKYLNNSFICSKEGRFWSVVLIVSKYAGQKTFGRYLNCVFLVTATFSVFKKYRLDFLRMVIGGLIQHPCVTHHLVPWRVTTVLYISAHRHK